MAGWIAPAEAKARLVMVDDAIKFHTEQGTLDTPMAARVLALRDEYAAAASKGTLSLANPSDGGAPREFTGKSSAAQAATGRNSRKPGAASGRAREFATTLWNERQLNPAHLLWQAGMRMAEGGPIDWKTCSDLIDALKLSPRREAAPEAPAPADKPAKTPAVALEPGYYRVGNEFFRVKVSKSSGRPYASQWVGSTEDGFGWDYVPGVIAKIRPEHVMDEVDAKEFGDEFHCCVYCTTPLTDQRSIDAGYGPKCAAKYSLPWG